jgi:hypothetical protein
VTSLLLVLCGGVSHEEKRTELYSDKLVKNAGPSEQFTAEVAMIT